MGVDTYRSGRSHTLDMSCSGPDENGHDKELARTIREGEGDRQQICWRYVLLRSCAHSYAWELR